MTLVPLNLRTAMIPGSFPLAGPDGEPPEMRPRSEPE